MNHNHPANPQSSSNNSNSSARDCWLYVLAVSRARIFPLDKRRNFYILVTAKFSQNINIKYVCWWVAAEESPAICFVEWKWKWCANNAELLVYCAWNRAARGTILSLCVCVYLGLMESRTRKGKFDNIVLMILSENWPVEPFNSITLFAFNWTFYLFISFTICKMKFSF